MSSETNGNTQDVGAEPDFAKAFQDLARGERAATALENHLDKLEKNIAEMLAKLEEDNNTPNQQLEEHKATESSNTDVKKEESS